MVTFLSAHNVREPGSVVAHDFDVYADTATAFEADDEIQTFVPIAVLFSAPAVLLAPPATVEETPLAVYEANGVSKRRPKSSCPVASLS